MKKITMILMMLAVALLSTGCMTDKAYVVGKGVYVVGEAVVEANADKLSDKTLEKLKAVDEAAATYDTTRTAIRQVLDTQEQE